MYNLAVLINETIITYFIDKDNSLLRIFIVKKGIFFKNMGVLQGFYNNKYKEEIL